MSVESRGVITPRPEPLWWIVMICFSNNCKYIFLEVHLCATFSWFLGTSNHSIPWYNAVTKVWQLINSSAALVFIQWGPRRDFSHWETNVASDSFHTLSWCPVAELLMLHIALSLLYFHPHLFKCYWLVLLPQSE